MCVLWCSLVECVQKYKNEQYARGNLTAKCCLSYGIIANSNILLAQENKTEKRFAKQVQRGFE